MGTPCSAQMRVQVERQGNPSLAQSFQVWQAGVGITEGTVAVAVVNPWGVKSDV